jgi:hypothetical protein
MKSILAALLITASFAAIADPNDPAIPPASRDRFLNGVNDFAGGKLVPGAPQDPPPLGVLGGGGGVSTPSAPSSGSGASWRASDGKTTNGSIVRSTVAPTPLVGPPIVTPVIAPQTIAPPSNPSPWSR